MVKWVEDVFGIFRRPSPEVLAAQELDDARRSLLAAQSAAEYANAMCAYHQARIERLLAYLSNGCSNTLVTTTNN